MADWDETSPADDDVVSAYPANERNQRAAQKTIFGINHHDANDADQGKHEVIEILDNGGAPTIAAGEVGVYNDGGVLKKREGTGTPEKLGEEFPSGTKMLFAQSTAPTGWTKTTTAGLDESILRLVTTTTFTTGGTDAFSTAFSASKKTEGHACTVDEMPEHSHYFRATGPSEEASGAGGGGSRDSASLVSSTRIGSTGGGAAHSHDITLDPKFQDVIIATKD